MGVDNEKRYSIISENKIAEIFQHLPESYAVLEVFKRTDKRIDARFVAVNEKYCKEIRKKPEELLGYTVLNLFKNYKESQVWVNYAWQSINAGKRIYDHVFSKEVGCWFDLEVKPASIENYCIHSCNAVCAENGANEIFRNNSTTEDAIIRITKLISTDMEYESIMPKVLEEIGDVITPNHIYIWEVKNDRVSVKFEWYKNGEESRKEEFQGMDYVKYFRNWENYLINDRIVQINDIENIKEIESEGYEILKRCGVHNFMCAPFFDHNKNLIGFLSVENYGLNEVLDTRRLLDTISYYIAFRTVNNYLIKRLEYFSSTDEMTGLKNRRVFGELLELLAKKKRCYGIIYIDINRFKSVNDRYGHSVGNEVLQEAAIRLKKASQYNVFRIGGDEFAILVDERIGIAEYQDIITNIHYVFSYDILDNDKYKIAVSVSAGYARAPEDSEVPDILREIADNRMYTCKKKMHEEMDKK